MIDANKFLSEVDGAAKTWQKYIENHSETATEEEKELFDSVKKMQSSLKDATMNQTTKSQQSSIQGLEKDLQSILDQETSSDIKNSSPEEKQETQFKSNSDDDLSEQLMAELNRIMGNNEEKQKQKLDNESQEDVIKELEPVNKSQEPLLDIQLEKQEQSNNTLTSEEQRVADMFSELKEEVESSQPNPLNQSPEDTMENGNNPFREIDYQTSDSDLTQQQNADLDSIKFKDHEAEKDSEQLIGPLDNGIDSQFHTPNILGTPSEEAISSYNMNLGQSESLFESVKDDIQKASLVTGNPNSYENMNKILMSESSPEQEQSPLHTDMEPVKLEPLDVNAYADSIREKIWIKNNDIPYQSKFNQDPTWNHIMGIVNQIPTSERNKLNLSRKQQSDKNIPNLNHQPNFETEKNIYTDNSEWIKEESAPITLDDDIERQDISKAVKNLEEQIIPIVPQEENSNKDNNKDNKEKDVNKEKIETNSNKGSKKKKVKTPLFGFVTKIRKRKKGPLSKNAKKSIAIMTGSALILSLSVFGARSLANINNQSEKDINSKSESTTASNNQKTEMEQRVDKALGETENVEQLEETPEKINSYEFDSLTENEQATVNQTVNETVTEQAKVNKPADETVNQAAGTIASQAVNAMLNQAAKIASDPMEQATTQAQEQSSIKIGNSTQVNEGSRIYEDEYNAYLGENSSHAYYNYDENRVILGVAILTQNGDIKQICANNPNANQEINNYLNDGGELVSVLTANRKYLPNYDGSDILTADEINAYAEGWYNINDIPNGNVKGMQR